MVGYAPTYAPCAPAVSPDGQGEAEGEGGGWRSWFGLDRKPEAPAEPAATPAAATPPRADDADEHAIPAAAPGLTGLSLALAACVSSAPPVVKPVDTTTPAQRLAAVDAAAGPDDKELSVQPLRDSQVEDLRVTAQAQRQANDLAGAASSLDHALEIVAGDPAVLQERAELALLQGQWAQAEAFARKAVDLGSKTGPLCRRHWATIEQSRLARGEKENAVSAHAQIEGCTVPGIKRY